MQVPPQLLTWDWHACAAQPAAGGVQPLEGLIGIVPGRVHFGDFHGRRRIEVAWIRPQHSPACYSPGWGNCLANVNAVALGPCSRSIKRRSRPSTAEGR
jgi:hypothetical protein